MGSLQDAIVEKAKEHAALGITEDMGNNRDSGGFIRECWKHVDDDRWEVDGIKEEPATRGEDNGYEWCAAYVSRLFADCGIPLRHNNGSGFYGCHRIIQWLASLDKWTPAYVPSTEERIIFEPGQILLFAWDKHIEEVEARDPDPDNDMTVKEAMRHVRHVGIVIDYNEGDKIVTTIEGNVGGVKVCKRHIKYLLGAGFPFDDDYFG